MTTKMTPAQLRKKMGEIAVRNNNLLEGIADSRNPQLIEMRIKARAENELMVDIALALLGDRVMLNTRT